METRLQRLVGPVSTLAGIASALMILAGVAITCQMIWVRFVLNGSTVWQTETVIYLVIGATLLGLPYVQKLRGHVSVDLLAEILPEGGRRVLNAIVILSVMVVIGLMLFYSAELWLAAWSRGWRSDTVWGVRLWIPYLAMPIGFGLYLLQLAADLAAELFPADPQSVDTDRPAEAPETAAEDAPWTR